jgi:hypothetical protein
VSRPVTSYPEYWRGRADGRAAQAEWHRANPDAALEAACDEIVRLEERQVVHLRLIAELSRNAISTEQAAEMHAQIASLIAKVGTLRAALRERNAR